VGAPARRRHQRDRLRTLAWRSWISPIGWVQHIFPYGGNHWWPAVLTLIFAIATAWLGAALLARRDLGAGLLPDRALAVCLLILLVGTTLQLDQWILDISPFTHVPHQPGGHATATPFVTLTVAAALGSVGLIGLRRRDIRVG
jgi:putative exporter of polyketide antibiotics